MFNRVCTSIFGRCLVVMCILACSLSQADAFPTEAWTGTVNCILSINGPQYQDTQVHMWTIQLYPSPHQQGGYVLYAGEWTVRGNGSNTKSGSSWTYYGRAPVTFLFLPTASGLLFKEYSTQARDLTGVAVTEPGKVFSYNVFEWQFPAKTIASGATDLRILSESEPIQPKNGYQEPDGSQEQADCTWNLHYGVILLKWLKVPLQKPPRH